MLAVAAPAGVPPVPAAVRHAEQARYRVAVGVLGDLGEITVTVTPLPGGQLAKVVGEGRGALLGMGYTSKRIEGELDLRTGAARRWTHQRISGGRTVTDFAVQAAPGKVSTVRRRSDRPDHLEGLDRPTPVMDPVTFLTRLRMALPTPGQAYEVLDGRGLWQLVMQSPRPQQGSRPTLRVEGRALPIWWDGTPDTERSERAFTVWLADDELRTPLRLVMPMGIAEVRVELVSLTRGDPAGRRIARALSTSGLGRTMLATLRARR